MPVAPRRAEVLLLLLSTGAFLLVAELAVRLLGAAQPQPTGYAPVNTNRKASRPRNSHGYRDLERSEHKPTGVRRVLSLGDSFAWGSGVEFEDAYPQRLERALARRRHDARWEVVNLALPGMNTVDENSQLAEEGTAYQPDVVLVGWVMNDSEDTQAAEARRARDWSQPAAPWALDQIALFRLVRTRLWATGENRRRVTGYKSMYEDAAPGWIEAQKALHDIGARCRGMGVPYVVAIFPLFGNPLDDRYPFPELHAKVAQAAGAAGARVVDLLPAYRGLRNDILVVDGADDEHPNEIAHRIAAATILPVIEEVVPERVAESASSPEPPSPGPAQHSPAAVDRGPGGRGAGSVSGPGAPLARSGGHAVVGARARFNNGAPH